MPPVRVPRPGILRQLARSVFARIEERMTTFTYDQVSPAEIQSLVAGLQANGAKVSNPSTNLYRVEGHGVVSNATYNPAASTLQVDVVSKPFYIPASMIDGGVKKALGRA